jgi:Txe/YoeB family toxin of Txe-Axe toxin-antitoxin module
MKLLWSEAAWEDCLYWQKADPDMLHRINWELLFTLAAQHQALAPCSSPNKLRTLRSRV